MRGRWREVALGVLVLAIVTMAAGVALAQATTYAGVTFPLGDISFADRAVSYDMASCVDLPYSDASAALGPPDCCDNPCQGCEGCDPCAVALGFRLSEIDMRGSLVLQFTDNVLRDVPGDDLFVYITNKKACRVEISSDGVNYLLVGEVNEYPGAIDISPFVSSDQQFTFVRLSDVPADEDSSRCPGPSIDAVGAMGDPVAVQETGKVLGSLELLPAGALALTVGGAPQNLLIILDTSSSMSESFEGSTKIVVAKQVLSDLISDLPDGMDVGLRIFGGCENSQLLLPISTLDRTALHATIAGISTGGPTPIAYTLEQTKGDFANVSGKKLILLVSDGQETCHGKPVQAAKDLLAAGYDLRIDVVGFDVAGQDGTAEKLREIANATHGTYYDAQSSKELRAAVQSIITVRYQVFDSQGQKVFEGIIGDTVPQLKAGTYKLVLLSNPNVVINDVKVQPGETTKYQVVLTDNGYKVEKKN
ncbi:VWA domain-containing protein [Candidatus Bipolaricaulota bacterium]|nr:VWA domain-containing protein [Candidatus Bipolaricaulota bacterium]